MRCVKVCLRTLVLAGIIGLPALSSAAIDQPPVYVPRPLETELSERISRLERSGMTNDQAYIRALVDLASVYFSQGRHAEARSPLRRAAAASERLQGPDHVQTREINATLLLLEGYVRNQQAPLAPPAPRTAPVPPSPSSRVTPPRQTGGTITSEDYPAAALRAEAQGSVEIELGITRVGRVRSCRIIASSGHSVLDQRTCMIAQQRFTFAPATVNRRPTQSVYRTIVRWILPD